MTTTRRYGRILNRKRLDAGLLPQVCDSVDPACACGLCVSAGEITAELEADGPALYSERERRAKAKAPR